MRNYLVSTLVLVFVLVTGACAGRQVRTRSVSAPPRAEIAASVSAPTLAVEAPVAAPAPVVDPAPAAEPTVVADADASVAAPAADEPALTTQQSIDTYVADEIAAHNAATRAAAEKLHRIPMPPTIERNDVIVAALTIGAPRKAERVAVRPRPKPKAAPAAEDDGREAAIGSLSLAPPVGAEMPAAPAAPSIQPAPRGAQTAITAGPGMDPAQSAVGFPDIFVPDPGSVAKSHVYWKHVLIGAAFAAFIGIVIGLLTGWRRNALLKRYSDRPYDHLPDGAILVHEVSGGVVVSTNVILPGMPPSKPTQTASEREAQMDVIEDAWHAESDVMEEEASKPPPLNDEKVFDFTDTPVEGPAPLTPVATPAHDPPPDLQPRLASGSGLIVSSSDEVRSVSGFTHAPDPPQEPRPVPETSAKVIVYEDDSSHASATAAPTVSN